MGKEDEKLEGQETASEAAEQKADAASQEDGNEPEATEQEGSSEEDVKDKHGQPGINKERHDKEVAELNAEIAKLKAESAEAAENKAKREEYEKKVTELETKMADNEVSHKLELAGSKNLKAAKALLDDYDGDVSKLKSECPYLFEEKKQTGSTGKTPEGAPSALDEKLDKAFELK